MNFLFRHRQCYALDKPLEEVETRMKWIVTRRWDDYSMDLVGSLKKDRAFNLTSKWGLVNIKWLDSHPGHIKGRLVENTSGTNIHISTSPNRILVGLFYLVLALFCVEAFEWERFISLQTYLKLCIVTVLNLALVSYLIFLRNGLERRFEELMQISRETREVELESMLVKESK